MNMRPGRREQLEVNIAPLIDVVFLLLIFFMVTTTFDRSSAIVINLPQATSKPQEATGEPLELIIDAAGRYYVNSQLLVNTQLDTLQRALTDALGKRTDVPLVISADAQTPHQAVVTALDAARQLTLTNVTIATRQPQAQ